MTEHSPRAEGLRVLKVTASGRRDASVSRRLARDLIDALEQRHGDVHVVRRDLDGGVPFVDEGWIDANFTPAGERSESQREALETSDALVREVEQADVLVLAYPMYNFGVPATMKAWIDMIARAGVTFRYTDNGPVGLLENKRAYAVMATGGVPAESAADFATPYLQHVMQFIGIDKFDVVAADQLNVDAETSIDAARARIAELVHTRASDTRRVA